MFKIISCRHVLHGGPSTLCPCIAFAHFCAIFTTKITISLVGMGIDREIRNPPRRCWFGLLIRSRRTRHKGPDGLAPKKKSKLKGNDFKNVKNIILTYSLHTLHAPATVHWCWIKGKPENDNPCHFTAGKLEAFSSADDEEHVHEQCAKGQS